MSDAMLDVLERIIDEPVMPLMPDRVALIEARLRDTYQVAPAAVRPSRVGRRIAIRAAAIAALVVAIAFGWMNRADDPALPRDLVLTSASKTVVVLSDGTRAAGRAGMTLPDGAVIIVGKGGQATIGETELAGGTTARVSDGEVEVVEPADAAATRRRVSPRTTPATTAPPRPQPAPPRPADRGIAIPIPTTVPPDVPSNGTKDEPDRDAPPATETIPTLRARATRDDTRVRIEWVAFTSRELRGYAVIAAGGDVEPTYPPGPDATVVARTVDDTIVTVPARRRIRFLVVALSADGRVLAASEVLVPR